MRRLCLLRLISFRSQYRKAVKTSLETVYIFIIYMQVGELIPVPCYSFEEKLVSYINEMTKVFDGKTFLSRRFDCLYIVERVFPHIVDPLN